MELIYALAQARSVIDARCVAKVTTKFWMANEKTSHELVTMIMLGFFPAILDYFESVLQRKDSKYAGNTM